MIRSWTSTLLPAGLIASITAVAVDQGGFYDSGFTLAQWTTVGLIVVALVGRRGLPLRSAPVVTALALGASALLSGSVNGDASAALPVIRLAAMAAGVAALVVVMTERERTVVLYGLVFVGVVLAAIGLDAAVRHETPEALFDRGRWRAASTLWYPNALGAVLVPLGLASLARLVIEPRRLLWQATTYALFGGVMATWSRGAAVGLVVGTLMVAAVLGTRRAAAAAWPVAVGLSVLAAALVPSVTGAEGSPLRTWAAFIAGLSVATAMARSTGAVRRALFTCSVAALALASAFGMARPAFRDDLGLASARDRLDTWRAGAAIVAEEPLWGAGPGRVAYVYRKGVQPLFTRYAHNDYLDLATSQGLVGLAVVAAGVGVIARQALRHRNLLAVGPWVGGVAALAALGAQAAVDFPFRFPVVTMLAAALAASVATSPPGTDGMERRARRRVVEADEDRSAEKGQRRGAAQRR